MIATWLGASAAPLAARDISDLHLTPAEWKLRGSCAKLTPAQADELFFPEHGQVTPLVRALCAGCPVLAECAEASRGEVGIWAGFSVGQRGVA